MFFSDVMGRLVHTGLGSLSLVELSGSWNDNPLVDVRTVARHADGRLGGLWNRHCLEEDKRGLWPQWFIQN